MKIVKVIFVLIILYALTGTIDAIFGRTSVASATTEIKASMMWTSREAANHGSGRLTCFLSGNNRFSKRICSQIMHNWTIKRRFIESDVTSTHALNLSPPTLMVSHLSALPMVPTFHMNSQHQLPLQRRPRFAGVIGYCGHEAIELHSSRGNGGGGQVEPPVYNGNDIAAEVFNGDFFYPDSEIQYNNKNTREKRLGDMTINELRQKLETQSDDFGSFALRLGAIPDRVKAYFASADDIGIKQSIAEKVLENIYKCEFHTCTVNLGDALRPLHSLASGDERFIDLKFLDALRLGDYTPNAFFIPRSVYVRNCMRKIFGLFQEDVCRKKAPGAEAVALVGSPGVGKSVLFFLAALYCAQSTPVVYYRRTEKGTEMSSMFMLTPDASGSVRVWFTRNIRRGTLGKGLRGLNELNEDLRDTLGMQDFYTFVDGPKKVDSSYSSDLLYGDYDYCCTSGGFPLYKSEEDDKRLWVLDGWTQEESIEVFAMEATSAGNSDKRVNCQKAIMAYTLCGGSLREMKKAMVDVGGVMSDLDEMVSLLDPKVVQLATTSTQRVNSQANSDRLRTTFAVDPMAHIGDTWKRRMLAYQIVDSDYLMNKLIEKLDISKFFEAYILAQSSNLGSSEGVFFERTIHQCVIKNKYSKPGLPGNNPFPHIWEVLRSTGTSAEGVDQLVRANMYWIPSVAIFPNIDSAIVVSNTLNAFSMTISTDKKFNEDTFKNDFVDKVRMKQAFAKLKQQVRVYYVVPAGTKFTVPRAVKDVEFLVHEIRNTTEQEVIDSLRELFNKLGPDSLISGTPDGDAA